MGGSASSWPGQLSSGKEVFELREHVTRTEYRIDDTPPNWDDLTNESSGDGSE